MRIARITMAVTHLDKMIIFYNAVFDAHLNPFEGIGGYRFANGQFGGFELLMCPNEIAGVIAEQNRHQFRFVVEDLKKVLDVVRESGGEILGQPQSEGSAKVCGVRDPEGNTIEFIQS